MIRNCDKAGTLLFSETTITKMHCLLLERMQARKRVLRNCFYCIYSEFYVTVTKIIADKPMIVNSFSVELHKRDKGKNQSVFIIRT
jgi:hypothetical protein